MAIPASPSAINPVKIAKARTGGESARRLGGGYCYGFVAIALEQCQQAIPPYEMQGADHHQEVAVFLEQGFDLWQPLTVARLQQRIIELRRLLALLQEFFLERTQVPRAP